MTTLYEIPEMDLRYEVDRKQRTIDIYNRSFKGRNAFLNLIRETYLSTLINQFIVGEKGCVDPTAWEIYQAVKNREADKAYRLAEAWYHEFDEYIIRTVYAVSWED